MARYEDHPLRLLRLRAGVSQTELARRTGLNRSSVAAIEEGRTRQPSEHTVLLIAGALKTHPEALRAALEGWDDAPHPLDLSNKARMVLSLPHTQVAQYRSFRAWREDISPSPTSFATLLGLPRPTVANYERGIRVNGFPRTLATAILQTLNVSNDYLLALEKLEPDD